MKKGKYIDYTILLACLSKKPTPPQSVDGLLDQATNSNALLEIKSHDKINKTGGTSELVDFMI